MFEKVNPSHPDKIADRIAGALVDLAYKKEENPRISVEVLIGHGQCTIIAETSVELQTEEVKKAVQRITGGCGNCRYIEVPQDPILSANQKEEIRCGDNGIFTGMPKTLEQERLALCASLIYERFPTDGKYIIDDESGTLIVCQSNAVREELEDFLRHCIIRSDQRKIVINPLGDWLGGTDVDTGATNRKLGSDMGDAVTGGGLHGKDLSKADVSVNIYAHIKANQTGKPVKLFCAIGDKEIDGKTYSEIVEIARQYIRYRGGFEKFAEWGLI